MGMIYTEMGEYDLAIAHCDELMELVKKSLNKSYNGAGIFQYGAQMKERAMKLKSIQEMNPVKRFQT